MKYLHSTQEKVLRINTSGDLTVMKWIINASFGVHPDLKSHTGATLHMGGNKTGALQVISQKQELNTGWSTDAELVAVHRG